MVFKKHLLSFIVIPLFILLLVASYSRFIVQEDYLVSYEGDCDPYTQHCYVYCEDDECSEPFYYSIIERHAAEIHTLCGPDVLECDKAYECQNDVEICSISFCVPETEECDELTEADNTGELNELET
jgi:hypothetical protein